MALILEDEFIRNATTFEPPLPVAILEAQAGSTCSSQTLDDLIKSPLPTSLHDNVDVTAFEQSGCFAIDDNKSGLYRIVHERNFARVVCNTTQKKFFPPGEKEKRVCITSTLDNCLLHNNFFSLLLYTFLHLKSNIASKLYCPLTSRKFKDNEKFRLMSESLRELHQLEWNDVCLKGREREKKKRGEKETHKNTQRHTETEI